VCLFRHGDGRWDRKRNLIHIKLAEIIRVRASFTLSRFSVPAALQCRHRGPPGPQRCDAGKHRIESGYTVLNRHSPGSGHGGFIFLDIRDAPGCEITPGHHRSSSGMNRISTVRPPGDTAANRHKLCPRWRYGDSRLGHGVSRRRAGVALVLAGRITVWHGGSRWMPLKLRWRYGMTSIQDGERQFNYINSI